MNSNERTKNYESALHSLCRVAFSPDQKYGTAERHEVFPIVSSLASELADICDFESRQIPYIATRVAERIAREYYEPEDDDEPRGTTPGCPNFAGNC